MNPSRLRILNLAIPLAVTGCSVYVPAPKVQWTKPVYETCKPVVINAPPFEVGLTVYRSDLRHRYDVFNSMHAYTIKNLDSKVLGKDFSDKEHSQIFAGFDSKGEPYYNQIWEDPENAMWEQASRQLIFSSNFYRADVMSSTKNLTVNSDSFYNVGVFSVPGAIGYGALFDGDMRPHKMNLDGSDKQPLDSTAGYAYGFQSSPDGTHYAFHSHYQVYIGNYKTGEEKHVDTPCSFNFLPVWSDDSTRVSFFCGASNVGPDIWIADLGGNARFLASRNGYGGVAPIMDGYDFHGGGSDFTTWYGKYVIYAAQNSKGVQLFLRNPDDSTELQLTDTTGLNYYPTVRDHYLLFNSTRNGIRNTYFMDLETFEIKQLTDLQPGCGVFTIKWSTI